MCSNKYKFSTTGCNGLSGIILQMNSSNFMNLTQFLLTHHGEQIDGSFILTELISFFGS